MVVQSSHLEHREEAIVTAFCYCAGTRMVFAFELLYGFTGQAEENTDFFLLEGRQEADKESQTHRDRKHVPQSSASLPDSQN